MANYNWLAYHSTGEVPSSSTVFPFLVSDDFQTLKFPALSTTQMDAFVENELEQVGIKAELEVDFTTYRYNLVPKKPIYLDVTAPLYSCNIDSGALIKVQDGYTATAISPSMYSRIKEKTANCIDRVKETQYQTFLDLFDAHSIDNGKAAILDITENVHNIPIGTFLEKYIPDGFLEIGSLPHAFEKGRKTSLFIKKFDAQGQVFALHVPSFLKGRVIGRGGAHIRYVARQVNAKRINVI